MLRLALKSVKHNPKRLILTAFAVALGVSLVAASAVFTNALSKGFSDLFADIYSSVDVVVEPHPDANVDPFSKSGLFSEDDLEAIRNIDGVAVAEGGVGVETGFLLNADRTAPANMSGAPTLVYNWTGAEQIDRSTVETGRVPTAPGEIVLDIDTFAKQDLALGDTVAIAADSGVFEFEVVGSVKFGESNQLQTATLAFATEDSVRELGGGLTGFATIEVLVQDGARADAVVSAINDILPADGRAITSEDKLAEQIEAFNDALQYVDIFAIAFAIIALFVGAYIIANTFRIIVTQRTREFGLLRAIGATGSQIRSTILIESVVIGIVASTLGILMGWGFAVVIGLVIESFSGDILGTMLLPVNAILWGYGLGVTVTLISALLPAIHASNISPMEALREAGTAGKKSLTLRNIVGAAMTLAGIVMVFIGLQVSVPRPYIWVGAGAVLIVLGVTLLAAQVLVPMAYGMRNMLTATFGVTGKLAANNIRREPRRSANTAAALMIGVMLLALVATFTESLKTVFTAQFQGNRAELFIIPTTGPIPQGAIDVVTMTDGVRAVQRLAVLDVEIDGTPRSLGIIDADVAESMFDYNAEPGIGSIDGGAFIDPAMVNAGYNLGDEIVVAGPDGTVTLNVTGLYLNEGDANVFVDWPEGELLTQRQDIFQVLIDFEDSVDVAETKAAVEENLAENFPLVQVQEPSEIEQFFNQALTVLIGVISGLLGAALLIALLGVANTLLLSVTERTREIGLLRAVGVKQRSVWAMITVEAVVMAVFGTILGIILGVSLGSALVYALEDFGFMGPTVPWLWILFYMVSAFIAGILAAVWPAWRASKLDILKAIATDG
ncbi:MAG: hypothetical protein CVT64_03235 [Actinobacteria bacterium HGW-Actinobacteria-4]|nr:MAG: hypothetical protein CVT64_03235 [Actinobacteria bacterium HGW-Actinobacteria-4]